MTPPHLSIRELHEGSGPAAEAGMWVRVHITTSLVGDGTLVEATRTSGLGDRDYGQPLHFQLGDMGSPDVLRALHPTIVNMRVGGRRRVRTSLLDPNWGYRDMPRLYTRRVVCERDSNQNPVGPRHVQGDWLMDVVVELEAVSHEEPARGAGAGLGLAAAQLVDWVRARASGS